MWQQTNQVHVWDACSINHTWVHITPLWEMLVVVDTSKHSYVMSRVFPQMPSALISAIWQRKQHGPVPVLFAVLNSHLQNQQEPKAWISWYKLQSTQETREIKSLES